jgi:membrane protease subunit (stomatin/prohibitin family)
MAAATLVGAQADAMRAAAANENGAMTGFMGMGMAMNTGNAADPNKLYGMAAEKQTEKASDNNSWKCSCGYGERLR